ncbi:hypothetical protein EMCG_07015 [[Emmonsia] crescens]|uniref:Uncharacterized protein n=1 Tax=[Emmonsia] crescens TaxID=73230 RepID=A0A0G2JBD6_9EURO|nr:hypothetical protein EMCG_07015 [Emmonsia crescens UAMH 3008]
MITTLQPIPAPQQQPGPVGCRTCLARGFWFTGMGAGPFGSKEELEAWFNHTLAICKNFKQAPETLILGAECKVWLIDWGDAGIYPEGFVVASLNARRFSAPVFTDMLVEMIPKYEQMVQQLEWIMFALTTLLVDSFFAVALSDTAIKMATRFQRYVLYVRAVAAIRWAPKQLDELFLIGMNVDGGAILDEENGWSWRNGSRNYIKIILSGDKK